MQCTRVAAVFVCLVGMSCLAFAQAQQSDQAKKDYLKADRDLGQYVTKIGAKLNPQQNEKLQAAQKAWTQYRDAAADAEASFYSEGSAQSLVHYTVLKDLTSERLKRLQEMMEDAGQVAEVPVVPVEDPATVLDQALSSDAVKTDVADMNQQLSTQASARRYLEAIVPTGDALVAALTSQKLNPDFLKWIQAHPEAGRDLVKVAVARELKSRASKDKKGFKDQNFLVVTEYLQGGNNKGGLLGSAIGQIAGDVAVRPLPPYAFYEYLNSQNGLAALTEAYIKEKLPAQS